MEKTYNRHPDNYSYPIKFTNKYLNIIKKAVAEYSAKELKSMITGVDAGVLCIADGRRKKSAA